MAAVVTELLGQQRRKEQARCVEGRLVVMKVAAGIVVDIVAGLVD